MCQKIAKSVESAKMMPVLIAMNFVLFVPHVKKEFVELPLNAAQKILAIPAKTVWREPVWTETVESVANAILTLMNAIKTSHNVRQTVESQTVKPALAYLEKSALSVSMFAPMMMKAAAVWMMTAKSSAMNKA